MLQKRASKTLFFRNLMQSMATPSIKLRCYRQVKSDPSLTFVRKELLQHNIHLVQKYHQQQRQARIITLYIQEETHQFLLRIPKRKHQVDGPHDKEDSILKERRNLLSMPAIHEAQQMSSIPMIESLLTRAKRCIEALFTPKQVVSFRKAAQALPEYTISRD